jgi:hemerythrin-like domain-containing protein
MENAAVRDFTGVHNMIRGLVALTGSSLDTVSASNPAQLKVLADLGQFAVIGTLFHHSTEDDYFWPAIVTNGADPAALNSLVQEHDEIDPLIDDMRRAFGGSTTGTDGAATLESFRAAFGPFRDHLLTHLNNEEPVFFPLLTQFMPDEQCHRLTKEIAKKAPRQGLPWLMGGVEYGMTKAEAAEFLASFPKPVLWLRPLMLRKYRKSCDVLGVDPATPRPAAAAA